MFGFFKPKKEPFSHVPVELRKFLNVAFPGGESQLENEAEALKSHFDELFTLESARSLVVWTKCYSLTNTSKSLAETCDGIYRHEKGRLTIEQCGKIYEKILMNDFLNRAT